MTIQSPPDVINGVPSEYMYPLVSLVLQVGKSYIPNCPENTTFLLKKEISDQGKSSGYNYSQGESICKELH